MTLSPTWPMRFLSTNFKFMLLLKFSHSLLSMMLPGLGNSRHLLLVITQIQPLSIWEKTSISELPKLRPKVNIFMVKTIRRSIIFWGVRTFALRPEFSLLETILLLSLLSSKQVILTCCLFPLIQPTAPAPTRLGAQLLQGVLHITAMFQSKHPLPALLR